MFIPLGDHPNPPKAQWVTRILIGLNVAIFVFITMPLSGKAVTEEDWSNPEDREALLAYHARTGADLDRLEADPGYRRTILSQTSRYSLFTQKNGYKPGQPSLWSLFFCMFLHADFLHIAGNLLFLWIFGDNVEFRLGRVGFLAGYLATGVVATLVFSIMAGGSMVPLVGASGAISGVLGFYLIWFPHNQVRVLFFFFFIFFVHVRALWVLLSYLVVSNLLPLLAERGAGAGGGVAYGAHLGGFVAGMLGAFLLNRVKGAIPAPRPGPHFERRRAPWTTRTVPPPAGPTFSQSIKDGRMEDAAHAFSRMVRDGGTPPAAADAFRLGHWLYESGFVPDAVAVFRYYIRSYPRGGDLDRVHLGLGVILARKLSEPTAAREHLLQAIELTDDAAIADVAREELSGL